MSNRLTTVALGHYVKEQLVKKCVSTERVANLLDCKVSDVDMFLRGDAFASFRHFNLCARHQPDAVASVAHPLPRGGCQRRDIGAGNGGRTRVFNLEG